MQEQPALIWLLKSDELKGLGRATRQKKAHQPDREEVEGRLEKLRDVAALMQVMKGQLAGQALWRELRKRLGPCTALTAAAKTGLWQLHTLFFTLCNLKPEEAAGVLAQPIEAIPFPPHALPPFCTDPATMSAGEAAAGLAGFEGLMAAVSCSDGLEWATVHGHSDAAYAALHRAATALLAAEDGSAPAVKVRAVEAGGDDPSAAAAAAAATSRTSRAVHRAGYGLVGASRAMRLRTA